MKKEKKTDANSAENTGAPQSSFIHDVWDFVKVFAISAAVILIFVNFIAHPVTVFGHSMDPTLADGEYGFTSRISSLLNTFERGDVVVVEMEEDGKREFWVKRIIGMPGETIESRDGILYIDGQPLDEPWLDADYVSQFVAQYPDVTVFTSDFGPVTLDADSYFVMGDNRPVSKDSRIVGPVSSKQLYGKNVLVLWPFEKLGLH